MAATTFLSNSIINDFILPFLLMFFIIFAILERTKLFGEGKKQLNALVAFVIALIFVGAVFPKLIVSNMILFLSVAIVIIFVFLLIWGFIFGDEKGFKATGWMKYFLGISAGLAVLVAIVFATGLNTQIVDFFSTQSNIWTNLAFIIVIVIALALVLLQREKGKS